jgi:hypothetical protein
VKRLGRTPIIWQSSLICHCEEPFDGAQDKLRDEAIPWMEEIASLRSQ